METEPSVSIGLLQLARPSRHPERKIMIRLLPIALLFVAQTSAVPAAPVAPIAAGNWTISGDVQGFPINETCTLTQTDAKIAGTCTNGEKTQPTTGTVADKSITFSHPGEYQGEALTVTFSGQLDDSGKLSGTIDVQPLNFQGVFNATKAAAGTPPQS
jgi:hypothetical protein